MHKFLREAPKWAAYMAVSTPVIAVLQGALLLYDYRFNHGDAPRPDVPSRGVVVVSNTDSSDYDRFWAKRKRRPPLRLLVIGDSLAAGVGTSESSTPILPESIAHSLSKAMGGRAVYWMCVGTPGLSASEIVQEIHDLEDVPTPLTQRLADFQAESRQRAQERLELAKRKAQAWWKERKPIDELEEEQPTESNPVVRWFRRKAAQIQRDVQELRHVIEVEQDELEDQASIKRLPRRGSLARRQTLDPAVVGKYDIAVVLTGLNDLKDTFLPFMMSRERAENLREAQKDNGNGNGGLEGELIRVVQALKNKMKNIIPIEGTTATKNGSKEEISSEEKINAHSHGPLVVFPALPVAPLPFSQIFPLNMFLVPLIHAMDRNKQVLAEMYPGLVLYVEAPTLEAFSEAEDKRGPLWEGFRKEKVHFQLTDIPQHVRERVEELMKQHYQSWIYDAEDEEEGFYVIEADSVSHYPEFKTQSNPGASLISADGIHPNDAGYHAWGRMIAQAIVEEWKRR